MEFFINRSMQFETINHNDMPEFLQCDDPLIIKTSWEPFDTSTTSFKSHNLKNVGKDRMEFRMSFGAFIFYTIVILFGVAIATLPLSVDIKSTDNPMAMVLVGLFFSIVGIVLFYFGRKKIILDKASMLFTKGNTSYTLKNVEAVQLVQRYIEDIDGNDNYYSHQLNLIFSNGDRVNILSNKNRKSVTNQAQKVSEFLALPLWDGRSTNLR